jgi:hypothetical protein
MSMWYRSSPLLNLRHAQDVAMLAERSMEHGESSTALSKKQQAHETGAVECRQVLLVSSLA